MRYIEGTPEEFADLHARTGLFGDVVTNSPVVPAVSEPDAFREAAGSNGRLPSDVENFIDDRAGASLERRRIVKEFVQRVRDLGGVEVDLGRSRNSRDGLNSYVMLRDSGPRRFGSVVYVKPASGRAEFRLARSAAEGRRYAIGKDRRDSYEVHLVLASEDVLDEATELAIEALQEVRH